MVEEKPANVHCNFQFRTDRETVANQPDQMVVDTQQEQAVLTNVAIAGDENRTQKLGEHWQLKEKIEKM